MSERDDRRDAGDFYPGGKVYAIGPVAPGGGDVKHSDFAEVAVKTGTIADLKQAVESLAATLGARLVSLALAFAALSLPAAEVQTARLADLDIDTATVVTNASFTGLATTADTAAAISAAEQSATNYTDAASRAATNYTASASAALSASCSLAFAQATNAVATAALAATNLTVAATNALATTGKVRWAHSADNILSPDRQWALTYDDVYDFRFAVLDCENGHYTPIAYLSEIPNVPAWAMASTAPLPPDYASVTTKTSSIRRNYINTKWIFDGFAQEAGDANTAYRLQSVVNTYWYLDYDETSGRWAKANTDDDIYYPFAYLTDIPAHTNADWNAASGPAQILNKPAIPATAADVGATSPQAVTNIVRDLSLGGIWDSDLQIWWTPRMRNGSLTYEATTNVNLNAGN